MAKSNEKWALSVHERFKKPFWMLKLQTDKNIEDLVMNAMDIFLLPEMQAFLDKHGENALPALRELLKDK